MTYPPHRFLNLVFGWCVSGMTQEEREKWEMMLHAPLPGQERKPPTEAELEIEGQAFMNLLAMHGKEE